MEGSELTSKFEGRTPMANIEYFDNKMKTERVAVQARASSGAEIQPASLIRAGHGIPVDLGAFVRIHATGGDSLGNLAL